MILEDVTISAFPQNRSAKHQRAVKNLQKGFLSLVTILAVYLTSSLFQKFVQLDVQQCIRDSAIQIKHGTRGALGVARDRFCHQNR